MESEIPDKWKKTSYGKVANINRESLSSSCAPDRKIEYIDISSVPTTGRLGETREMTFDEAPSRARRRVHSGDTLVSKVRPYLRSFVFIPEAHEDLIASTGYAVLSPREQIDPQFLYQTVLSNTFLRHLEARMTGSNYPAVKVKDVKSAPVLVPPLPEQKKIAAILAGVDEAIEATEAVIKQTRRVKKGLLQELLTRGIGHTEFKKTAIGEIPVGWEVKRLDRVADVIDPNPSHRYPSEDSNGVPIASTENFRGENSFDLSGAKQIPVSAYEQQRERCGFAPNDIVFARKGRLGLARPYGDETKAFSHTVVIIKTNTKALESSFLLWLMRSRYVMQDLQRRMNTNSGVPTLGIKLISKTKVPLPSTSEQRRVASILSHHDDAVEQNINRVRQLRAIKKGLLQDLLTGKVRVNVDEAAAKVQEAAGAMAE